jgi:hypothetical protein
MSDERQDPDLESKMAASRRIMSDEKQREEFLKDPSAYLERAGIVSGRAVNLSERDKEIVKMVADPEVLAIYKSGDVARLSGYLRATYQGLVNDPIRPAWTIADFEVAIEAVAVAIGVAVFDVRMMDDYSEAARIEAVLNRRIDALEGALQALQDRVNALPHG